VPVKKFDLLYHVLLSNPFSIQVDFMVS